METVKDQWLPGVRGMGEMNRRSTEDFQGSETIPYVTIMVHTCHYTFAQTYRIDITKSEA